MAKKVTKKELQSKSIPELKQIKKEILQSKSVSELKQIKSKLQKTRPPLRDYDEGDLSVLQYMYDNACSTNGNSFESIISNHTTWWDNGRLAGANFQCCGSTHLKLCGDNALPENIGDLTEISYLDIGLENDITRLPESIGNLFHYSIYELADRNGGGAYADETNFEECRQAHNNLKWWPHPDYNWQAISDYTQMGCPFNNIHLDGNKNLGLSGTIPESLANWSHINTIYWGIGQNISEEEFDLPDVGYGWTHLWFLKTTGPETYWGHNHGPTTCMAIPNMVPIDYMNYEGLFWLWFGDNEDPSAQYDNWTGPENCDSYWLECPFDLGDINGDGGISILDIVTLANCVLAETCGDLFNACAADMNGDGGYNVLDVVALANCVLQQNCGRKHNGRPEGDTPDRYLPPAGITQAEQDAILQEIVSGNKTVEQIVNILKPIGRMQRGGRTTTNQVTLPNGDTVTIPTFPENPPTSTSRDFYTCEHDWCCIWDGSTNEPNNIPGNNLVYPQADFSYSFATNAFPMNFLFVQGTIYIDGGYGEFLPSTNPMMCTESPAPGISFEDCTTTFIDDASNWNAYESCNPECNTIEDCGEWLDQNGGWGCNKYQTCFYNHDDDYMDNYTDCSWNNWSEENCPSVCQYWNNIWPNYGMYGWNDPTGNADTIAAMWSGTIVGFEFVNTVAVGPLGEGVPIPGITLPIQHRQGQLTLDCYPNMGDRIDDLILYKASTGTYYQLTEESYDIFINAMEPIGNWGFSFIEDDLHFELYTGDQPTYQSGDLNLDSEVDVLDVIFLIDAILDADISGGIPYGDPAYIESYDLNGDGNIDVADVVTLIQIVLNNPQTTSADRKELEYQLSRLDGLGGRTTPLKPKFSRQQLQSMSVEQLIQIKKNLK